MSQIAYAAGVLVRQICQWPQVASGGDPIGSLNRLGNKFKNSPVGLAENAGMPPRWKSEGLCFTNEYRRLKWATSPIWRKPDGSTLLSGSQGAEKS
jgi:hypothetical protein